MAEDLGGQDERSAKLWPHRRRALMILVYLCCFLDGHRPFSSRYPIPSGEVEAEMLYLKFISG